MSTALEAMPTYWGKVVKGRVTTDHGFTVKTLLELRKKQQLAPLMISFNWLTPFFNSTQNQIKELEMESERTGKKPTNEDLMPILTNAVSHATKNWAGVLVRIGLQTAMASALIHQKSQLCDSIVLQWDTYPRLHQKYFGDLLQKIFLPRAIASLMGPATKPEDLVLWETVVSPQAAAQDSLKRHALVTVSNVTVQLVMHLALHGFGEDKAAAAIKMLQLMEKSKATKRPLSQAEVEKTRKVMNFTAVARMAFVSEGLALLGCLAGSAAGRLSGGGSGKAEYWGEFIGASAAAAVLAYNTLAQTIVAVE